MHVFSLPVLLSLTGIGDRVKYHTVAATKNQTFTLQVLPLR